MQSLWLTPSPPGSCISLKVKKEKQYHPEVIGRLGTANFTFGFLTNNHENPAGPRAPAGSLPPPALSAGSPKAPSSPPRTQPRAPRAGRTLAQPLRSSWRAESGPRGGSNAGFNFPNLRRGPRSLPVRRGQRGDPSARSHPRLGSGSCTLRPLFPSPPPATTF